MTTFLAIAENSTLEFMSFTCEAKGKIETVEGKLMMSEIFLYPTVVIHNEAHVSKTTRILKKAKNACLITRSIQSKVTMGIAVLVKPILIKME